MTNLEDDNEIVPEDLDDSVVEEEYSADKVKKLKGRLKEAEDKAKEYLDGWQKSQADFVNLRKRDEEDRKNFIKFASQGLVEELIPVLDSFNIALAEGHEDLRPIYNQLLKILKQNGLEEMEALGETFDPRKHESVGMERVEKESDDHKVIQVLQNGYTLAGRVLRPAKVRIGEFINN